MDEVRVVESNLKFSLSDTQFVEDLGTIWQREPEILCLCEVDARDLILDPWAKAHGLNLVHFYKDRGQDGDTALLFSRERFEILATGCDAMHGEPPNKPTKRYAVWAIVQDRLTGQVLRVIGFHSLASVEKQNTLKTIPRVAYYVNGIKNLILLDRRLKVLARSITHTGSAGLLLGDLNWGDRENSWLRKTLGIWYTSNYQVLGVPNRNTLGKTRSVDYAMKRGYNLQWIWHYVFELNSDHNGLLAILRIKPVK